jgi:glycosyltransferase involved in cell wall biosynthesis
MTDNSVSQKLPFVSIVTVTFNAKAFLEKTLTSVKQQTYPNIEYLVIDGNSTDNTKAIADNYRDICNYAYQ